MNEEDLLSRDMKALALPHDVEEGLRLVRRKVVRVRRMRTVLRVAVVIAVLALAFIGGRQAWMALRPNPVVVIVDTDIADGSAMVDGTTTAAGGLASVAQEPLEVVTHIVGAADSVGPRLAFSMASYEWGTGAGRFGNSGGVGSGPTVFATAPDVESIAVLDTANNRVQILELGGGWRSSPTPLPEGGPYVDVAICADGNLALLAAGEVVLINLNGEVLARHAIGWDRFLPEHLSRSGADLWIVGTQNVVGADGFTRSYPFLLDGLVLSREAAADRVREGWVTAGATFKTVRQSSALHQVRITPERGQSLLWSIVSMSGQLVSSYQMLSSDSAGNYYLAVMENKVDGEPAEATWCVVGLTPAGEQLGQVRWRPANDYPGGGFEVGADGWVYYFQATASGLRLVRYGLETDVAYLMQEEGALVQGYLAALHARLVARGIAVISVTTDTGNPALAQEAKDEAPPGSVLPLVCVRVAAAALASPDGIFVGQSIEHEVLYMVRHGVPVRMLVVVGVNDDGTEQMGGMKPLGDLAYSNHWDLPGEVGDEESAVLLEQGLRRVVEEVGMTLISLHLDPDDDGFHPHLVVSVGGDASTQTALISERAAAVVEELTERGVKVPVFRLSVNSRAGEPLLRSYKDQTVGGGSYGRWASPTIRLDDHMTLSVPIPSVPFS